MPKVSIITVVLNNINGLRKTMDSVLLQSYTDFEFIIVDGSSTDGTVEMLEKCTDPRVKWISEPDEGCYDAQRKAIQMAQTEYITFLDSGNWFINRNILAEMLAELKTETDFIAFPYIYEKRQNERYQWKVAYPDPQLEHLYFSFDMFLHGALVRRTLFEKYGLPDSRYKCSGDHALVLQFYINGVNMAVGKTVNIYFLDGGISADPRKIAYKEDRQIAIEFGVKKWRAWAVYFKRMALFNGLLLLRKIGLASAVRKALGKSPDMGYEQLRKEYCDPFAPWFDCQKTP